MRNVHERQLPATATEAGRLIDGLAGEHDRLWPREKWPPITLDRPLAVGARGGHGPIRYRVSDYSPGRRVTFEFERPRGLTGHHGYELDHRGDGEVVLRYFVEARMSGSMRAGWPLIYRPLHDALIEDSLDRAEAAVGAERRSPSKRSLHVRLLRRALRPRRR